MAKPSPKATAYFAALVRKTAQRENVTEQEVHKSLGLLEQNAWGWRVRESAITAANISRCINELRQREESAKADALTIEIGNA